MKLRKSRRTAINAKASRLNQLADGNMIYIEGKPYKVVEATADGAVTLDGPIVVDPVVRRGVQAGTALEVFIYRHTKSPGPDKDMQLLLRNMAAHKPVTQLLNLPFEHNKVLAEELPLRDLMLMGYRLLKALTLGFPQMQAELSAQLPLFLDHTSANLVAFDISPTGCINAVCQDNRDACVQVPPPPLPCLPGRTCRRHVGKGWTRRHSRAAPLQRASVPKHDERFFSK
eukprot:2874697-Prymnesium_polylepis.1